MAARTQAQRRSETRSRLLEAAATVFAERGIEGASVDAIADAAGRTSGALYAHFGSKEGLLLEVVDTWMDEVAAATLADFLTADTLDDRLRALWRNFIGGSQWVRLEHELWQWATRNGNHEMCERLQRRYAGAWRALAGVVDIWARDGEARPVLPGEQVAPLIVGLLLGLEMQHRVDSDAVTDDVAVAGLRLLLGATTKEERP